MGDKLRFFKEFRVMDTTVIYAKQGYIKAWPVDSGRQNISAIKILQNNVTWI